VIHSDGWAAYLRISELGFEHATVNHSLHFVNPVINSYAKCRIFLEYMQDAFKGDERNQQNTFTGVYLWNYGENKYARRFIKVCCH
jgi:hypothetical protein